MGGPGSDDGIIDDRDDRLISASDSRVEGLGLGLRGIDRDGRDDLKRPLPLEHLERDVDMRSLHDPDDAHHLPPHHSHHHSHSHHLHHSHSSSVSLHGHQQRHYDEVRAAKKMRMEDSSTREMVVASGPGHSPGRGAAASVGGIP